MSQERHLNEAQISAYLSAKPDVSSETNSGTESHLEECESCRSRTLEMHREQMGFRKAGRMNIDCPEDEILQLVAAGGSDPAIAARTMDHAARCSHCGPRLKKLANIFSDDLSPEQQKVMSQLQTSKPEWQREFIRDYVKPRGSSDSRKPGLWSQIFATWWGRAGMAAAAAAVVLAAVFQSPLLLAKYDLYHAQKLVASAYGERRTIEPRFSGVPSADFKPYPVVLGPDDEHAMDVNRPALMKAEGNVAENVKGQDPRWLQLQGRISLLESTPKSIAQAQKYFEDAQRKGLNTPSLKIDLASSYYEHDVRAEYPNLQRTLDLLLEVLHQPNLSKEDKAAALFDLAIAYEKTQAWDLAASTWEDYLKVDSSGRWADEARDRLKKAKEKIPAPKPQGYNQPIFFLEHLSQLKPEDPEEYQAIALSQWLPDAVMNHKSDAYSAGMKLAAVMQDQHHDLWMRDFLQVTKASDLSAVQELVAAIRYNAKGSHNSALEESRAASSNFAAMKNLPGKLLADFEEEYALRNLFQSARCSVRADPLLGQLARAQYRWLQTQAALESAQCRSFQGELAQSDSQIRASLITAQDSGFPVVSLRILGISASLNHKQGRCDQAWNQSVRGLELYWKGSFPRERLDQFYAVMWQCAEESGQLFSAEELLRHTIQMRSKGVGMERNLVREGMLHLRLKNIYVARQDDRLMREEDRKSLEALNSSPEPYAKEYQLVSNIEPADLLLRRNDAEQALSALLPLQARLSDIQDTFIHVNCYRLLGNAYLKLNRFSDAATAYQSAIKIAESSLITLKGDADRLLWLRAMDQSYRGDIRVLLAQHRDDEALQRWEWYKGRSMAEVQNAGGFYNKSRSWLISQRSLLDFKMPSSPPFTTRMIFANFADGVQIWAVSPQGITEKWVPVQQDELDQAVHRFNILCADPDSSQDALREEGVRLFGWLIEPMLAQLSQSQTLIVELDDANGESIPLEALRNSQGDYLIEKYSFVYSPGLWLEKRLRSPGRISAQDSLLFVDASHSAGIGFLPGAATVKNEIANSFPRARIRDAAHLNRRELSSLLATSDIFHFLGHGRPDGNGTDLIMSNGEFLTTRDFPAEVLQRPRLVVLSACSSGVGKENGLLDTANLVHSFLSAGVPDVIASQWNVDSETTGEMMSSFYGEVIQGATAADALRHASLKVLRLKTHPYYWAGFNVAGKAN